MALPPKTYEDWLALPQDQRDEVHQNLWDTYERDGIGFAYMAASRFALTCPHKVLDLAIGTYHGGEYLLHVTVSADDYEKCPPMLEDSFEGFRIVWLPQQSFEANDDSGATLEGAWVSDDGCFEFEFTQTAAGLAVRGNINGAESECLISHPAINEQFVIFSAYDTQSASWTQHSFQLVGPNSAEDGLTESRRFRRKEIGEQVAAQNP